MLVIANLPRYKCAENYQNRAWFDKVIATLQVFDSRGSVNVHNSNYIVLWHMVLNKLTSHFRLLLASSFGRGNVVWTTLHMVLWPNIVKPTAYDGHVKTAEQWLRSGRKR